MVYCGKPSRACAPCRAKKRRCDLVKPSCGQCRRAGQSCTGYREEAELSFPFRDQTVPVTTKVQALQASKSAKEILRANSVPQESSQSAVKAQAFIPTPTPTSSLCVTAEEFATAAFYHQVIGCVPKFERAGLHLIPDISSLYLSSDTMLTEAIIALGLIAVPETRLSKEVTVASTKRYISAVSLTNKALGSHKSAINDKTLFTIILLSMYEAVTCSGGESIRSWAAHLDGACNLLAIRGEQQFHTPAGVNLYLHLRSRIVASYLSRALPCPESLTKLSRLSRPYLDDDELTSTELSDIAIDYSRFRAVSRDWAVIEDIEAAIETCQAFDARLEEWAASVTPSYAITSQVSVAINDNVYGGYFDVYKDSWICHLWNNYRTVRMMVQEDIRLFVLRQGATLPNAAQLMSEASTTINNLSESICASIPFLLNEQGVGFTAQRAVNLHDLTQVTWFLMAVARLLINNMPMRQWAILQLTRLTEISGVQQGRRMANMVRSGSNFAQWTSFPHHPIYGKGKGKAEENQ